MGSVYSGSYLTNIFDLYFLDGIIIFEIENNKYSEKLSSTNFGWKTQNFNHGWRKTKKTGILSNVNFVVPKTHFQTWRKAL